MQVTLSVKLALIKEMEGVFQAAAKERNKRPDVVADPVNPRWTAPAWMVFERERMHAAVNAERARRGLVPVDLRAIARVESLACGHVDYAKKYPLYCAEIALGEVEPRP